MNTFNKNIAGKPFLKIIEELNSWDYSDKSMNEIISVGLNLFKNFPEFNSVSLFMLDETTFDFQLKITTEDSFDSVSGIFNDAVEDETIAKILTTGQIVVGKKNKFLPEGVIDIFLPLISGNQVVGIIVLYIKDELTDHYSFFILCEMYTRTLSLVLSNRQKQIEIDRLKIIADQAVSQKVTNAVKDKKALNAILNSLNIGIMIIEKKTKKILDINLFGANFIGADKNTIVGTLSSDYFYFAYEAGKSNNDVITNDSLLKSRDGKLIPVILYSSTLIMGGVTYSVESFINISERKKAEDALQLARFELEHRVQERTKELLEINSKLELEVSERKKAEDDLQKIYWAVHNSPSAVIITDTSGIIEYVNPRFCAISGYKFEEVVGRNPRFLKAGDLNAEQYKMMWNCLLSGKEWKGEFRNKKKNGELYWVSASISAVINETGEATHYMGLQEDITRQKSNFEALILAKQAAEQSDRLKTSIIANLSHELRTPLIAIMGYSQFMMGELDDKDMLDMASDINLSGKRLLKTLNNLLYLSHIESISMELTLLNTNIVNIVNNIFEDHRKLAKSKNLNYSFETLSKEMYSAIDEELFKNAIENVVDNAIKFTVTGNVKIKLETAFFERILWNVIIIEDTGVGISKEDLNKIFEAFQQLSEGYARSFEGCGLGLTITQKIIDIFRGRLVIDSQPNVGSKFAIWLPALNLEVKPGN
jgi:PAS domain S-box-containing protein